MHRDLLAPGLDLSKSAARASGAPVYRAAASAARNSRVLEILI
jgi:hypothetical protein